MDDYLKLHQVPSEDHVKCATRNFHDYASTWWPHVPSTSFHMSWSKMKTAMRREFVPSTYMEHLRRQLENTKQGSKSLDKYFMEMKAALRRAGVDDPTWMKYHFSTGLNHDIAKKTFLHDYESLDDLYIGALKAEQEIMKATATRPRAHFTTTKLHDDEHEGSTTKMPKPDELQDDAPKFDFTAIPLCGIDNAESTTTLFEDGAATTTEPLMDKDLEASDKVSSKDDASIFGGKSEMTEHGIFPSVMEASGDVPSSAFIYGDDDEMVEHGIFPSTTAAYGDELRDLCTHIESESKFTTNPIYDEMPQFPCEESHPHHDMSVMSDSTICEFECIHLEGVSEPPHRESELVDRSCEAILQLLTT